MCVPRDIDSEVSGLEYLVKRHKDKMTTHECTVQHRDTKKNKTGVRDRARPKPFSGSNWIDLVTGVNKPWSFRIMVDLTNRSDKERANSSPRADMFPLVRLAYGCNHTIVIPVHDADGDNVRCRWANGSTECAGVCRAFPNSILNEDQCTITYSATDKIGYYAVAIQVEDFRSIGRTPPLSSVPIQFLVYIYKSSLPCNRVPVFLPPTKSDKTFVTVQVHMTVTEQIVAKSGEENTR
ncbi:hypothetical protein CHS0354_001089 [Potamilus streckersoni]|uniref:Uncharacterized protein n=1 Tax=Potamilus streckersoni TaxID=2493646 RepID=A0AAE0RVU0_9BIVA|nr:hypothetical protein CHS0354_001089 [Potamilus streckersoni]